ncbi:MAG TPA: permease [Kofleriaceae bacterium]|nr:permease [Kofleriaceae bacterium]
MDLILLITSVLALALGPLMFAMADRARATLAALDGFVMVAVAGLALVHIIPHAAATAGIGALAVAIVGFIGPGLIEHRLERAARQTHTAALVLALAGLTVHEFFDGVGLATAFYDEESGISILAIAVVLHRLPIAVTVWWLVRPLRGPAAAWGVLVALAGATLAGYASVDAVAGVVDARWLGMLEALIAGSLLHVVVHRPPPIGAPSHDRRERLSAGIGALLGLAAVASLGAEHHVPLHEHARIGFSDVFLALALESAPPLLLAFGLAGLVQVVLPSASLRWMRTGRPTSEAVRGVAFGLPLPICSCGVIPLYQTLVTQGVPATAAMAFLVATPELGIDSVLISLPLLGGEFTAVRVVAAAAVALLVGVTIGRLASRLSPVPHAAGCAPIERPPSFWARMKLGLRFGFGEIVDHTAPWILLGIAIAALAEPVLEGDWITRLPFGVDVVIFAFIGMPVYVCASGATPLVAVLVHEGISPGAALAFLLTGPATNATTFGVLARLHGPRIALAFGGVMAVVSIGLGMGLNLALPEMGGIELYEEIHADPSLLEVLSLAGLTLVLALSVLRQGPRGFVGQILSPYGRSKHDHGHAHGGDHDHDHGGGDHDHGGGGAPSGGGCC